jgi:hypothetical protein
LSQEAPLEKEPDVSIIGRTGAFGNIEEDNTSCSPVVYSKMVLEAVGAFVSTLEDIVPTGSQEESKNQE